MGGTQLLEAFHNRHDTIIAPPVKPLRSLPSYIQLLQGEAQYWESLISNPTSWANYKTETAKASATSTAERTASLASLRREKATHGTLKLRPTGTPPCL